MSTKIPWEREEHSLGVWGVAHCPTSRNGHPADKVLTVERTAQQLGCNTPPCHMRKDLPLTRYEAVIDVFTVCFAGVQPHEQAA